jgi:hexosaminidase
VKLVSAMRALSFGICVFSGGYYSDLPAQHLKQAGQDQVLAVIPRPQTLSVLPGAFGITSKTSVCIDPSNEELRRLAVTLLFRIKASSGYALRIVEKKNSDATNAIILTTAQAPDTLGHEGYWLQVGAQRIVLKAPGAAGIFYGLQTLVQLLPEPSGKLPASLPVPAVEIIDKPRLTWRGMMLDVGRYFYPVEDVKKFIDYMAMYKMNTFQWHLTEDQGWRIEIKKYPALTQTSAWRDGTIIGHLNDQPRQYDGKRHGGYYTQEQVRDIIAYAAARYITVVPEIEMPGHSVAALAAYPELSCTGGPFSVSQTWGVHEDVYCAGNEQTFVFLQDVLTEVAALFPSPIIHIGGDECPKTRWRVCSKCQSRIKQENLKDEHELQSYFIRRIENFLLTKNKSIIGWDEILEGGLAPNAMVMSWRGITGGITAAKQRHGVVMTPRNPAYMDYYQGDPAGEPLTIGGMNTLQTVYAYDPVPAALTKEEARYILGSQANVWTEYMPDRARAEYMIMPRMAALAEVTWTTPARKNWNDFTQRMQIEYARYARSGIRYSTSAYNVQYDMTVASSKASAILSLHHDAVDAKMFYTIDGTAPGMNSKLYTGPLTVEAPLTIQVASFIDGKQHGKTTTRSVVLNKAYGSTVRFVTSPDRRAVSGNSSLLNNLKGSTNFRDGEWVGYYGKEMTVIIDLDTLTDVHGIRASFLHHPESNAFLPEILTYYVSPDGETYIDITRSLKPQANSKNGSTGFPEVFSAKRVRYIKVSATPRLNAGEKTWLYADEIVLE